MTNEVCRGCQYLSEQAGGFYGDFCIKTWWHTKSVGNKCDDYTSKEEWNRMVEKKVKCEKCGWEGGEEELEFMWCYQLGIEVCPKCLNAKDLKNLNIPHSNCN